MRKTMSRLFMAVMMVMLLCSLTIISASAAEPTCDGSHADIAGWVDLNNATSSSFSPTENTDYYLSGDLKLSANLVFKPATNVTATVHMCGHKISFSGTQYVSLGGTGTVNFVNCSASETGTITSTGTYGILAGSAEGATVTLNIGKNITVTSENAKARTILAQNSVKVNLYGCTIKGVSTGTKNADGTVTANAAAAVSMTWSTVNMYDGTTITGTTTGNGGGVYMSSDGAKFNMYGGTITGCSAANGGGVYMSKGTFTMDGGTISNCTVPDDKSGGGVYVAGGTFNMKDGTISGCSGKYGGGVRNNATFNLEGGTISGNIAHSGGNGSDIYANGTTSMSGGTITGTSTVGTGHVAVTEGKTFKVSGGNFAANLYANAAATVEISGGYFTNDPSDYVISGYAAVPDTSVEPYQYRVTELSEGSDHGAGWTTIDAAGTIAESGYYHLKGEIEGNITVGDGTNAAQVTLCMCGHSITHTSYAVIVKAKAHLILVNCDSSTGGNITNSGTGTSSYGIQISSNGAELTMKDGVHVVDCKCASAVYVGTDSVFNMVGGDISNNVCSKYGGVWNNKGTFNMSGGTISGNDSIQAGGGVYNSGNFYMTGGTISGNNSTSSKHGGGVYNSGTFEMTGGTISDNTAATYGGGVATTTGKFILNGGTISGNTANSASSGGGGVHVNGGTFEMLSGTISGNKAPSAFGGGVYVAANGTFTLKDGTISGNEVNTVAGEGGGGGVCTVGTFNMAGGNIVDNTTGHVNGLGIYVKESTGKFYMTGGTVSGTGNLIYVLTPGADVQVTGGLVKHTSGSAALYTCSGCKTNLSGQVRVYGKLSGGNTTDDVRYAVTGGQFSSKVTREALQGYIPADSAAIVADVEDGDYIYKVCEDGFTYEGEYVDFKSSLALGVTLSGSVDGYTATYTKDGKTYPAGTVDGVNCILAENIVAREMDKDITFTITNAANDVVFQKTMSIYDVAQAWQGTDKETLVDDMINYGIEAQVAFNDDHKATMETLGATETAPRWADKTVADIDPTHGVNAEHKDAVAVTLSLKDQIELNVYVNDVIEEADVTSDDSYTYEVKDGITRISFKDIPVNQAAEAVTLTAGDAEVTFSITDYCILAKDGTQKNLINALMKYIESVYQYYNK